MDSDNALGIGRLEIFYANFSQHPDRGLVGKIFNCESGKQEARIESYSRLDQ